MEESHRDKIWKHVITFNKIDLNKNSSIIRAKDIKNSKKTWSGKSDQFEPRLLCKMDNSSVRPQIFKDNNICLIAVENGEYMLIKENIYIPLKTYDDILYIIENNTNSLLLNIGDSETLMLDKLYYNNVFNSILGEKITYNNMLSGRHRCSFDTIIGTEIVKVRGVQYEIDGCYESENYVCIVEAKNKEFKDFNIRQLYYPFRAVYEKVRDKKKIICLFICKNNKDVINIYIYEWNNYKILLDYTITGYYQIKIIDKKLTEC